MKIYLTLDENGYVDGWGSTSSHVDNEIEIDLAENHDFFKTDFACWKHENGELVFGEEKQKQLIEEYAEEYVEEYAMNSTSRKTIQELDAEQQELKGRIAWLEAENKLLREKIKKLKGMIS